jgi:hypothetical protein
MPQALSYTALRKSQKHSLTLTGYPIGVGYDVMWEPHDVIWGRHFVILNTTAVIPNSIGDPHTSGFVLRHTS